MTASNWPAGFAAAIHTVLQRHRPPTTTDPALEQLSAELVAALERGELSLPLTEERRRDLAKTARTKGEDAKISVRNARRTAKDAIKKTVNAESLSEDMQYEAEETLQNLTDRYVAQIDKRLDAKEKDIMTV